MIGLILALLAIALLSGYVMRVNRKTAALVQERNNAAGVAVPDHVDPQNQNQMNGYIEDQIRENTAIEDKRLKCRIDLESNCEQ